jgi:hypothetical protein
MEQVLVMGHFVTLALSVSDSCRAKKYFQAKWNIVHPVGFK